MEVESTFLLCRNKNPNPIFLIKKKKQTIRPYKNIVHCVLTVAVLYKNIQPDKQF